MSRDSIEKQAAMWLLRREEQTWHEADQAALDAWLDESPEHEAAFWRLEHGQIKLARMAALAAPVRREASQPALPRRRPRRWLPAAAVLAAAMTAAVIELPNTGLFGPRVYTTNIGGREELPLPDGSKVELNTATRLRADVSRTRREIWLDRGEAFFAVAHDPSHPFVVHAGPKTVTVLGTKFSVRRDGEHVEVAVLEGLVRIDNAGAGKTPAQAIVITRGDIAVGSARSTLVEPKSVSKVDDALSWRQGRLKFHETTLAEAAAQFNRYNRTKLVIVDPQAAGTRIGGNFQANNVEDFARLLSNAYGFRVDADGKELKVSSPH